MFSRITGKVQNALKHINCNESVPWMLTRDGIARESGPQGRRVPLWNQIVGYSLLVFGVVLATNFWVAGSRAYSLGRHAVAGGTIASFLLMACGVLLLQHQKKAVENQTSEGRQSDGEGDEKREVRSL